MLPPELARGLSKRFNDLHRLQPRALNQHHLQHAQQLFQLGNASRVRVVGLQQPLFAKGVRLQAAVDNITRLVLREAMPATPSGKIQKFRLREIVRDGSI